MATTKKAAPKKRRVAKTKGALSEKRADAGRTPSESQGTRTNLAADAPETIARRLAIIEARIESLARHIGVAQWEAGDTAKHKNIPGHADFTRQYDPGTAFDPTIASKHKNIPGHADFTKVFDPGTVFDPHVADSHKNIPGHADFTRAFDPSTVFDPSIASKHKNIPGHADFTRTFDPAEQVIRIAATAKNVSLPDGTLVNFGDEEPGMIQVGGYKLLRT